MKKAFDLHQVVEFLQGQVDVRHPVSTQKEQDAEDYDTLVVTLQWKDGVCPLQERGLGLLQAGSREQPDPEVKKWVYWAERGSASSTSTPGAT
jgi:hypothetical protein